MKTSKLIAAALGIAGGLACGGQVLADLSLAVGPGTANNGSGTTPVMVFFDLTNLTAQSMTVTSFDIFTNISAPNPENLLVYTHDNGTWAGNTANTAYWNPLSPTVATALSTGPSVLTPIDTPDFTIAPGATTAVVLMAVNGGFRFNGTNAVVPTLTYANTDLRIDGGASATGATNSSIFNGTVRLNRMFAGNIYYTVAPSPAAASLFGIAGLTASRRRR